MFTAKPSQPVNLPEFQTKSYIKRKETNKTKQNKTNKKYNVLLEIERNRCYVSLPWQQNFQITTNLGPSNMAGKKMICVNFGGMIALTIKNRTAAHRLFVSGSKMKMTVRLYQERLLRFRNFASMVTWRFSFL